MMDMLVPDAKEYLSRLQTKIELAGIEVTTSDVQERAEHCNSKDGKEHEGRFNHPCNARQERHRSFLEWECGTKDKQVEQDSATASADKGINFRLEAGVQPRLLPSTLFIHAIWAIFSYR